MEKKDLYKLTDEELLVEKKKMMKSKLFYATWIGFLGGILIFGVVAWSLNPEKKNGIPDSNVDSHSFHLQTA